MLIFRDDGAWGGRVGSNLTDAVIEAKVHDSIPDAVADLGGPNEIGKVFSGFQRYLYIDVI